MDLLAFKVTGHDVKRRIHTITICIRLTQKFLSRIPSIFSFHISASISSLLTLPSLILSPTKPATNCIRDCSLIMAKEGLVFKVGGYKFQNQKKTGGIFLKTMKKGGGTHFGYIVMLRARMSRSLIIRTGIKERNIRAPNIMI